MNELIDVREKVYNMIERIENLEPHKRYIQTDAAIYMLRRIISYIDRKIGHMHFDRTAEDW